MLWSQGMSNSRENLASWHDLKNHFIRVLRGDFNTKSLMAATVKMANFTYQSLIFPFHRLNNLQGVIYLNLDVSQASPVYSVWFSLCCLPDSNQCAKPMSGEIKMSPKETKTILLDDVTVDEALRQVGGYRCWNLLAFGFLGLIFFGTNAFMNIAIVFIGKHVGNKGCCWFLDEMYVLFNKLSYNLSYEQWAQI